MPNKSTQINQSINQINRTGTILLFLRLSGPKVIGHLKPATAKAGTVDRVISKVHGVGEKINLAVIFNAQHVRFSSKNTKIGVLFRKKLYE